jgi:hypothetical protein
MRYLGLISHQTEQLREHLCCILVVIDDQDMADSVMGSGAGSAPNGAPGIHSPRP